MSQIWTSRLKGYDNAVVGWVQTCPKRKENNSQVIADSRGKLGSAAHVKEMSSCWPARGDVKAAEAAGGQVDVHRTAATAAAEAAPRAALSAKLSSDPVPPPVFSVGRGLPRRLFL